ncbi:tRNA uridine-5-carboxymethylaminomethyl(34) synthesis GTPase MnmE [Hallella faecis]|uniref:tRNA modification GTPase MnmE n=1 Tax=Hallella faecis TaxID=2841596 RepID=A0ABV1FTB6_9BACT|nr:MULTISPECIES: tRNA uridine-5-carboxymethylaminomethyl(34) synthesis GTPase MnmE [Hallella]MDD7145812.1 tRNA uridine-5-carboxymethylaminomethyl(34) synthesis GTPase MnmE [Hallella sp.]MDY5924489.1 tRNA uridine-5-carboxymethylaminomethyl(34) synthesis GTPase MnmE [Hallella sp.]MED9946237.1 tRNA uridine-5-carboxymethylaminomethyl(34) synthesis GTPase MnmE [Hallella sp.]
MNTFIHDTICAIATRAGGALSVIRVSGANAVAYTDRIFQSASGKRLAESKANTLHYGTLHTLADASGAREAIDDVVVSLWRAPHSYTGDDVVEISCHGSQYIAQNIIQALIACGCRQAEPGEYTMRAYLNGKMDLSQAEAVADLIAANNKASHDLAVSQLKGHFSSELQRLRQQLLKLTSLLELELDFSDHEDLEFADRSEINDLSTEIFEKLRTLCESFKTGQALKQGIPVAIVGKTNVGKSTLLNQLLNEDKAIVSDIDGTTRDIIDGMASINGVTFRFVDTAGIRTTDDAIEKIGIERAYEQIAKAAIVVWMIDGKPTQADRDDMARRTEGKPLIVVHNKADLSAETFVDNEVAISAKRNENIQLLKEKIMEAANIPEIDENTIMVTNMRHFEALHKAMTDLQRVIDGLASGLPSDLLAEDLRLCLEDLADITGGQITSQETLNNIFQHFCVGK